MKKMLGFKNFLIKDKDWQKISVAVTIISIVMQVIARECEIFSVNSVLEGLL